MQREYQSPEIRELRDQQMRFAPRAKKLQQVEAADQDDRQEARATLADARGGEA